MQTRNIQKLESKIIFTKMGQSLLINRALGSRKVGHRARTQIHQSQSTVLGCKMTSQVDRAGSPKHLLAGKASEWEEHHRHLNHRSQSRNRAEGYRVVTKNLAEFRGFLSPKRVLVFSTVSKAQSKSDRLIGAPAVIERRSKCLVQKRQF